MKQTVNKSDFRDAFNRMDRKDNFTYEALGVLFDYYEQLDDDCGTETELDVIAICCEWCEYDSLTDVRDAYSDIETLDELRDHTTVIEVGEGLLVQAF